MRRCVVCKADIPPQTEVCPKCRRLQHVGHTAAWVLIAVVLFLTQGERTWNQGFVHNK